VSGREILEYFDLEYALQGNSERSFVEFIRRIGNAQSIHGIKGLIFRCAGRIVEENPPAYDEDFLTSGFPDMTRYINVKKYQEQNSHVQIQTKRGCALQCIYCSFSKIEGSTYRFRSPGNIVQEIEKAYYEHGIDTFTIVDSAFNIPLDHAKAVLLAIIEKSLPVKFGIPEINPGEIDEELIDLLQGAHCDNVVISVESGSDLILENLKKNYTRRHVLETAALFHHNIKKDWNSLHLSWSFLLGAPLETEQTLAETLDCIKHIALPYETVFISTGIRIYKGTPLASQLESQNSYVTEDHYLSPLLLEPENISLRDINDCVDQWARQFPNILLNKDKLDPEKIKQFNVGLFMQRMLFENM
jgi:radical SAM superfamily enzyme YgiQ (UPF0313 family)